MQLLNCKEKKLPRLSALQIKKLKPPRENGRRAAINPFPKQLEMNGHPSRMSGPNNQEITMSFADEPENPS
jgi:hypothetical protein